LVYQTSGNDCSIYLTHYTLDLLNEHNAYK
jgi:hypothetical protein